MMLTRDVPRAERHNLPLPCLNCQQQLPPPPWTYTHPSGFIVDDVVACLRCEIPYSGELLRTAHAEVWAYVMRHRLFCFDCGDPWLPVVYQEDQMPVACPKHGPAPSQ